MTSIATIGYEGRAQHDLIELLVDAEITLLVDVRIRAQSRKPGFSKSTLAAGLAAVEIGYEHLRALGTPLDIREEFRAGNKLRDVAAPRERYREYLLGDPEARVELETLAELCTRERVAFLCFEHDPRVCHRAVIAEELLRLHGISTVHLGVPVVA
jgi:uncharacterized protein (DUF488 family)